MVTASIVQAVEGGVVVHIHVQPRAGTTEITGRHGDALRIRVAAPPVDGRATTAALRALADALSVPASAVHLLSGDRSRLKRVKVDGIDEAGARARLARWLGSAGG
jgi:uncharacterized protein (TIGR00251 family)